MRQESRFYTDPEAAQALKDLQDANESTAPGITADYVDLPITEGTPVVITSDLNGIRGAARVIKLWDFAPTLKDYQDDPDLFKHDIGLIYEACTFKRYNGHFRETGHQPMVIHYLDSERLGKGIVPIENSKRQAPSDLNASDITLALTMYHFSDNVYYPCDYEKVKFKGHAVRELFTEYLVSKNYV